MEGNSLLIRFGLCLKFILLANGDTIRDGAGDVSPPPSSPFNPKENTLYEYVLNADLALTYSFKPDQLVVESGIPA